MYTSSPWQKEPLKSGRHHHHHHHQPPSLHLHHQIVGFSHTIRSLGLRRHLPALHARLLASRKPSDRQIFTFTCPLRPPVTLALSLLAAARLAVAKGMDYLRQRLSASKAPLYFTHIHTYVRFPMHWYTRLKFHPQASTSLNRACI